MVKGEGRGAGDKKRETFFESSFFSRNELDTRP